MRAIYLSVLNHTGIKKYVVLVAFRKETSIFVCAENYWLAVDYSVYLIFILISNNPKSFPIINVKQCENTILLCLHQYILCPILSPSSHCNYASQFQ